MHDKWSEWQQVQYLGQGLGFVILTVDGAVACWKVVSSHCLCLQPLQGRQGQSRSHRQAVSKPLLSLTPKPQTLTSDADANL